MNYTDENRGEINTIYWPKIHIGEGLQFRIPTRVHQFVHYTRIHPVHFHVNIIRILLGVSVLNITYGLKLGLEEILYAYTFRRHKLERFYLVVDAKALHLVTNLPNTSKNKPQGNVLLRGA